ncbi:hypothetical protein [Anabaena sp. FACHB-709]|uniref:hypothetical protein n=1 Tax=Anabaena sp. FACHB-709 TaxID=1086822 RepID=UPI00031BE3BD|nr:MULTISPECIES: hypothetical protein [Nostocaceae]
MFQSLSPTGYGVHTSLKIPPSTWFRHLGLGCAIALEACPQRGGTTKQSQKLRDYVITSLRS